MKTKATVLVLGLLIIWQPALHANDRPAKAKTAADTKAGTASAKQAPKGEKGKATAKKAPPAETKGEKELTDARIKKLLIEESIDSYSGNCPCPYNTASNGSSCGGRSAWSRAGGQEPLCYPKDVSADMVQQYRATHSSREQSLASPEASAGP